MSHLRIPGGAQPWEERDPGKPGHIASALEIMLDGPIGAASFNNEFGRPNLSGYFRTFEHDNRGYHKPIMLAGGLGSLSAVQSAKAQLPPGTLLVQLGRFKEAVAAYKAMETQFGFQFTRDIFTADPVFKQFVASPAFAAWLPE